jgi:hypothetical protein
MKVKALLAVISIALPAAAQDYTCFQTPSGNIHCMIDSEGVRCDILEANYSFTKRPADCELDYGGAFFIDRQGRKGVVGCVGDTVASPGYPVLGYGSAIEANGITCTSERSGVTCTNSAGHGFSVARVEQKVF